MQPIEGATLPWKNIRSTESENGYYTYAVTTYALGDASSRNARKYRQSAYAEPYKAIYCNNTLEQPAYQHNAFGSNLHEGV